MSSLSHHLLLWLLSVLMPVAAANLELTISPLRHGQGQMRVQLVPLPAEQWPTADMAAQGWPVTLPVTRIELVDLAVGDYALRLFQDLDDDGQLALDEGGLPLEPVAFSTNPSLALGEPWPSDCRFTLPEDGITLSLELLEAASSPQR